MFDDLEPQ